MVEKTIKRVLKFFDIKADVLEEEFHLYKKIPKDHTGIYIIQQGDQVIYVGKGQIKSRQGKHWDKAFGSKTAKDTSGWRWLREHVDINPVKWRVNYILLHKQTELSAVEGALIHLLQPLANDETFKDNERVLGETK
jgi:hypothetical protein